MENNPNKLNIPWEDDEIEFLKGNWMIRRSDCFGLYRYTIYGIDGQSEVDAVQLIEWGMAKVCDYPSLHPWENSDIAFTSNFVIIRDPRDDSSPKGKRRYLIEDHNGIQSVNKYWLIINGLATYGEKTKKEISSCKMNLIKALTDLFWEEDALILVPQKDVSVSRAHKKGKYLVVSGGVSSVRDADYLVRSGLAERLFDAQLKKLADNKKVTMRQIGNDLDNFWYIDDPDSVVSLRQLAKLVFNVENGEVPFVEEILAEYQSFTQSAKEFSEKIERVIPSFDNDLNHLRGLFADCQAQFSALKKISGASISEIKVQDYTLDFYFFMRDMYFNKSIEEFFSHAETLSNCAADFDEMRKNSFDIEILPKIKSKGFPDKLRERIDETVSAARQTSDLIKNAVEILNDRKDVSAEIENMRIRADKMNREVKKFDDQAQKSFAHKARLDEIVAKLTPDEKRPKHFLFNRTYKPDKIKFTTAAKISVDGIGSYTIVYGNNETAIVHADDLIYMNLAVSTSKQ